MTKTPQLEERLQALDPPYESKEQRQIGRTLDYAGVPFFYRRPTLLSENGRNAVWHPDFTLPGYDGLVIDYVTGKPDTTQHKKQVYANNDIASVFIYPNDLKDPELPQKLFGMMYQAVRKISFKEHPVTKPHHYK